MITGEEFLVEKKVLAKHDLYQFDVKTILDTVPTAATWMEQNKDLELVTNLTRKANIITKGKSVQGPPRISQPDGEGLHLRIDHSEQVAARRS